MNRPTWGLSWGSRHPSLTCSAFRMFLSWQVFPFNPASIVRNSGIILRSSLDFSTRSCQFCLRRVLNPACLSPWPLARAWRSLPHLGLNAAASLSHFPSSFSTPDCFSRHLIPKPRLSYCCQRSKPRMPRVGLPGPFLAQPHLAAVRQSGHFHQSPACHRPA